MQKSKCKVQNCARGGPERGFTLLEVLISIAVGAVLIGGAFLALSGTRRTTELDRASRGIVLTLRDAQTRAIAEQASVGWGVRFVNVADEQDYYALFSGASFTSATSITQLSSRLEFSDPAAGAVKDVTFSSRTGLPVAGVTVVVGLRDDPTYTKTITIAANGTISF